jgi:hypothetical protein
MNHVIIVVVTIAAATLSIVAAAVASYHAVHRIGRLKADADVTLVQIYRSHVASMEEETADAMKRSLPDDEWLSSVKAEAEARLRRDTLYLPAQCPSGVSYPLTYRRPPREFIDHSTISWVQ